MLHSTQIILLGGWLLRLAAAITLVASLRLFLKAHDLDLDPWHFGWLLPLGLTLGIVKARKAMRPRLAANVDWLRDQARRQVLVPAWRLFPPRLMLFIASMIALVVVLKAWLAGHALGTALLGSLDLAVATALALSSSVHDPVSARVNTRASRSLVSGTDDRSR